MNDPEKLVSGNLSLGQQLRAAREAHSYSMGDVAQQLLLSKQIITDLENDDYSKIAAPVYAKGYLKAYAQFLQLPIDEILRKFDELNVCKKPVIREVEQNDIKQSPLKKHRAYGFVYAIAVIVILIVIVLIGSQRNLVKSSLLSANSTSTTAGTVAIDENSTLAIDQALVTGTSEEQDNSTGNETA